jgi:RNA polymerase sigma-70 factor (ECF subfamily)
LLGSSADGTFPPARPSRIERDMAESDSDDVTTLLEAARQGDEGAANRLASRVQGALRAIAAGALRGERRDHTLQATELVDEAFMRLIGQRQLTWQSRAHFYAMASQVIRRILVDHARRRRAAKRDHGLQVTLDEAVRDERTRPIDLIELDTALERLASVSPRQARVVELRFFGGLDIEATAEALAISTATVKRDWTFARAFLLQALGPAA